MQLHELTTKRISPRSHRVGRGGKRGKTSGRGGKGQSARADNKPRPEWRDTIKKIPKRRGYGKNRGRTVVPKVSSVIVTLSALSARFNDGDTVTPRALSLSGITRSRKGKTLPVKVLGGSALGKKITLQGIAVSPTPKTAIP